MKISLSKRKNPDLNPRVSVIQRLKNHQEKASQLKDSSFKNSFCSFTEIEKLGLNPQSFYPATPLGVYSYPTDYLIDLYEKHEGFGKLFVSDSPFFNLFSVNGEILNLSRERTFLFYIETLSDIYQQNFVALYKKQGLDNHRMFWRCLNEIAEKLARQQKSSPVVVWNVMFRRLKISGCLDEGTGIIHTNEPTQAVFFNTKNLYDKERWRNPKENLH